MQPFRSWKTAVLGSFAVLALATPAPAGQTSPTQPPSARPPVTLTRENQAVIATIDLMNVDWKYAPCQVVKDGAQAGFTWVADAYKKEYAERPEDGWRGIDHLPRGGSPAETMQPGISCGWFRRTIDLPAKVGAVDVTGATPYLVYTVDDYAETFIDSHREFLLPLGNSQPWDIKGFNVPIIIDLTAKPFELKVGGTFQLAIFAVNGPIPAPYGGYFFRQCRIEFRK